MVIFHSYVSLPEGTVLQKTWHLGSWRSTMNIATLCFCRTLFVQEMGYWIPQLAASQYVFNQANYIRNNPCSSNRRRLINPSQVEYLCLYLVFWFIPILFGKFIIWEGHISKWGGAIAAMAQCFRPFCFFFFTPQNSESSSQQRSQRSYLEGASQLINGS